METPEKIYLQPRTIEELPHQNIVYTKPLADNSIEYTCTDAFIEKALDYIENNIYDHYDGDHEYGVCGGFIKKEEFIDGFKNFMKK